MADAVRATGRWLSRHAALLAFAFLAISITSNQHLHSLDDHRNLKRLCLAAEENRAEMDRRWNIYFLLKEKNEPAQARWVEELRKEVLSVPPITC